MKLLSSRGGVNRVIAVLLLLIGVMLVIIAIPAWERFRERSEVIACEQAMKSAKDGLIIEYLGRFDEGSVEEAMKTLDQVMVARPNICPAGGEVYLLKNDQGVFEPFCGLHDPDAKRRTRLNASRAKELLTENRRLALREYETEPRAIAIHLNGQTLQCVRVDRAQRLRRGTATTDGFDGVVAFYGLAGEGDFPAGNGVRRGEIAYFIYADEDHCAAWQAGDGWSGDAYWM